MLINNNYNEAVNYDRAKLMLINYDYNEAINYDHLLCQSLLGASILEYYFLFVQSKVLTGTV